MKKIMSLCAVASMSTVILAGCTPPNEKPSTQSSSQSSTQPPSSSSSAAPEKKAEQLIVLEDGVVREKPEGSSLTAIFGELKNNSDSDITVTGFETSLGAPRNEIHETIDGTMSAMEGGLTIAPGESVTLEPGGTHLMILGYPEPILAGDSITITLLLEDGTEVELGEVPVRAIGAGGEKYSDHAGHDHDHADHDAHNHEGH